MAIYRVKTLSQLKKFAIKINNRSCTYVRDIIPLPEVVVPISIQITPRHFEECEPHTFNFDNGVVVIVENKESIFIVPYSAKVMWILENEEYTYDDNIYIPNVSFPTLVERYDKRTWKIASIFCK